MTWPTMSFLSPGRLWFLVVVALLLGAYAGLQARRRRYAMKFTNLDLLDRVAPRRPGWRRHIPAVLFLLSLLVLVVGFAQPTREERVPRERATIVLAIDTSLSMQASDVTPSRIEAAKAAAKTFVDLLPPKLNVGLVLFNGNAQVKVAPTTDREAVKRGITDAKLGEKTAIGEAIFTSLDAISSVPSDGANEPPPARIVLMSDGYTTSGRANDLGSEAAVEAGVPISTIAFGTDEGTITVEEEPFPVRVPVDRLALQDIAAATQGKFYAAASETQLREVYENIGSSVGYTTEERDASAIYIGVALGLLFITGGLSLVWFSRLP